MTEDKDNQDEPDKRSSGKESKDTGKTGSESSSEKFHTPTNGEKKASSTAIPMGSIKVEAHTRVHFAVFSEEVPESEISVLLDRTDITEQYVNRGITVLVRIDDEKSDLGINGGRISRLTLVRGEMGSETILAHFDNGEWLKPPSSYLAEKVVREAEDRDNGLRPTRPRAVFRSKGDPDFEL